MLQKLQIKIYFIITIRQSLSFNLFLGIFTCYKTEKINKLNEIVDEIYIVKLIRQ